MKRSVMAVLFLTIVFFTGCGVQQQSQASYIGVDAAKSIALEHAGLQASEVTFTSAELDNKNDVYYYDIGFTSGSAELDYDIDAITGVIIEHNNPSPADSGIAVSGSTGAGIASSQNGSSQKDGASQGPGNTGTENSAVTGQASGQNSGTSGDIGADKAMEIALEHVPGAKTSDIYGFEREIDDGRTKYEGTIVYKQMEYDFEIDAYSGALLEWDAESIYD